MSSGPDDTPVRLTRAEAKARTRELLLDAGARVFARRGLAGASVDGIAAAAGLSSGALYSNFRGKDDLFLELLSTRAGDVLGDVARVLEQAGGEEVRPSETVGPMLAAVADKRVDMASLSAEFWLYAVRNPAAMESLAEQSRAHRDAVAELLTAQADRAGAEPVEDPQTAATVLLALFQGLARRRRIEAVEVPDELFGRAMRWLFLGMRADATEAASDEPAQRTDD